MKSDKGLKLWRENWMLRGYFLLVQFYIYKNEIILLY